MTLGIYIHVPFCSRRCDYCDFATWVDKEESQKAYFEAISNQLKYHINSPEVPNKEIDTIFFGGGTPNLVNETYIGEIIHNLSNSFRFANNIEITIECNPDHVTNIKMQNYFDFGINRISLGIQSTNENVLKYLGREHTPQNVYNAIEIIRNTGIENISGDLIYGSANESIQDWEKTLIDVIYMNLNHISAYALGIEKGTPLHSSILNGEKKTINEDDLATKYELADQILSNNDFYWYEISNWSRKNYESKHNLSYWLGGDIIALGCAAHGYTQGKRWSTPRNIDTYIERFKTYDDINESCFKFFDDYSQISEKQESFALKIRTKYGVIWPREQLTENIEKYIDLKMLNFDKQNSKLVLTPKGRLLAHSITVDLFEEYEPTDSF